MEGSSWPSMSSFSRLSSMEWYSKWVVTISSVGVVGGVLHRAEVVDLHISGDDDHAAGVLTGGTLDAHAPRKPAVDLRGGGVDPPLLQVFFA